MNKRISLTRTFAGHPRTICDCEKCQTPCTFLPGYLHPEDLQTLSGLNVEHTQSIKLWAESNLRASLGMLVMLHDGSPHRVFTLVPAPKDNGECQHFIDGKCGIHENSPFGCAFFDSHERSEALAKQSTAYLMNVWMEENTQPWAIAYRTTWWHLANKGFMVLPPELRQQLYREKTGSPRIALPSALSSKLKLT